MAQDPELAGHVLGGKYRLVRSVSDGPLKVYEARHERLSGRFAVTLWPATTPWDAFRRGAELAVTLRHPGVVQVLDFNCEPGASPFLVLEWIDGERLSDLIAESGLLPIQRVAPLIESAAWALASAHQQGIVHEELRPKDIFVVHAAGTMREWVKLGGFGVSAALARARTAPPSRYRAPEQTAGARSVAVDALEQGSELDNDDADPQSDQYALAAIAYEMLAGVPPFDEERSQEEPLSISDLAPGVSPAVDAAIRQALAAEPEQRFAGVLEFARALRAAADGASPETVRRWRLEGDGNGDGASDGAGGDGRRRRNGKNGEAVSPFFNPLQSAGEAFRRVATTTARLRTLAGARLTKSARLPGSSTRIALASGALLLAFSGAAVVMKRAPRRPASAVAPTAPVASARAAGSSPAPAVAPPPEPEVTPVAAVPTATATPVADVRAATVPAKDEGVKAKTIVAAPEPTKGSDERAAAWARLASTGGARARGVAGRGASAPAPKVAPAHPKPVVAKAAVAHPAAASSAGSGPCVLTVGSKPLADVWIDERSLGRRTPVVGYHLACGDHKLVLKRSDLDIYQMEIITLRPGAPFKKVYPLQ